MRGKSRSNQILNFQSTSRTSRNSRSSLSLHNQPKNLVVGPHVKPPISHSLIPQNPKTVSLPLSISMGKPRNKNPKSNNTPAPEPEPEPSDSSSVVDCGEMNPTAGKNKAEAPPAAAPEPKKLRRAEADAAPSPADVDGPEPMFVGKPLPAEEARRRWPDSYRKVRVSLR